jgi:hypothetical protein
MLLPRLLVSIYGLEYLRCDVFGASTDGQAGGVAAASHEGIQLGGSGAVNRNVSCFPCVCAKTIICGLLGDPTSLSPFHPLQQQRQ